MIASNFSSSNKPLLGDWRKRFLEILYTFAALLVIVYFSLNIFGDNSCPHFLSDSLIKVIVDSLQAICQGLYDFMNLAIIGANNLKIVFFLNYSIGKDSCISESGIPD